VFPLLNEKTNHPSKVGAAHCRANRHHARIMLALLALAIDIGYLLVATLAATCGPTPLH